MSPDQLFILEVGKYFIATALIIGVAGTIVGSIAFWRTQKGAATTFSRLIERGNVLQLLTVLVIVSAISVLAVLDKIKPEGVIAILSGVAGYVLGGLNLATKTKRESEPEDG